MDGRVVAALLGVPTIIQRERWLEWLPLNVRCCQLAAAVLQAGVQMPPHPRAKTKPVGP